MCMPPWPTTSTTAPRLTEVSSKARHSWRRYGNARLPRSGKSLLSGAGMDEKVKFYTDEHVPRAVARGLRQRGVDVLTAPQAGLLGATDEEHLERARAEGRVLF